MSNITVTLVSGQTAVVGVASSREAYEVEVSSGIAGATGVGVSNAAIIGGMLNITLSNTAVINAGSVVAPATTGTITFTNDTIGQFSNTAVKIKSGANVYSFGNTGVTFPDGSIQTTAYTGGNTTYANTAGLATLATTANNALYLGGVAANQYAYANATVDRLTSNGFTTTLQANGVLTLANGLNTSVNNSVTINTSRRQFEWITAIAGSGANTFVANTSSNTVVLDVDTTWTVQVGSDVYAITAISTSYNVSNNDGTATLTIPGLTVQAGTPYFFINPTPIPKAWEFDKTGTLTLPGSVTFSDNTVQTTAFTGSYDQLTTGFVRVPQYATATNIFQYLQQGMSRTGVVYVNQSLDALTYWAPTANAFVTVQTTAGLSANVAALTSNNTLYLGGTAANQYTTYSGSYTWSGDQTFTSNVAVVNINSESHAQVGYNITGVPAYSGAGSNTYIWMNAALSNTNTQAVIARGDITGWTVTAEDNPSVTATVISMNPVGYWGIGTNVNLPYAAGRTFKFTSPDYAAAYVGPVNIVANGHTWAFNANGSLKFADNSLQTTAFTGNANNALYLGGIAAASYLTVSGGNITANTGGFEIGYKDVPQNYTNTSFTLALSDRGKHIYTANGTAQTITIANNATVAFPVGTAISIVSQGAGTITVARGTGVSLYLAANNTSADRTIATYGMATLLKVATDTWFISGAGVA